MSNHDDLIEAIYTALERWDAAERRARDLRGITKANVKRVDRLPNGDRILTPRRSALARYITDAVLTELRKAEQRKAATPARPTPPTAALSDGTPG